MTPLPTGFFGGGILSKPILNQLSAGTTVIAAWSTARKLKTTATSAFYTGVVGGGTSPIGFNGANVNTAALTAANLALYGGPGGNTSQSWTDQTGNGNLLGRGNSFSSFCPITTGGGALNAPVTCVGGFSAPMLSLQYNGLSSGNNGPYLSCAALTGSAMATDYGTSNKFWFFAIMRRKSGVGAIAGSLANYQHGAGNPDSTLGSCDFFANFNSTTSGLSYAQANSGFASATTGYGAPTLIGAVFDGTHVTLYVNRVPGTASTYTGSLVTGGNFGVGDWANAGTFGTAQFAADVAEIITGTTLPAPDLALIQANMRAYYNTP